MVSDHHDLGGDYMALNRLYPLLKKFHESRNFFCG